MPLGADSCPCNAKMLGILGLSTPHITSVICVTTQYTLRAQLSPLHSFMARNSTHLAQTRSAVSRPAWHQPPPHVSTVSAVSEVSAVSASEPSDRLSNPSPRPPASALLTPHLRTSHLRPSARRMHHARASDGTNTPGLVGSLGTISHRVDDVRPPDADGDKLSPPLARDRSAGVSLLSTGCYLAAAL